ncbi:hypothetical protein [Agrobacterium cavarae]|uniref:hypothetical protein n=1 Tax=Agrobacterium cavarae TaxID=2528239 RepID=UPI002FFAA0EC
MASHEEQTGRAGESLDHQIREARLKLTSTAPYIHATQKSGLANFIDRRIRIMISNMIPLPASERSKTARNEIRKHRAALFNSIGIAMIVVGALPIVLSFNQRNPDLILSIDLRKLALYSAVELKMFVACFISGFFCSLAGEIQLSRLED